MACFGGKRSSSVEKNLQAILPIQEQEERSTAFLFDFGDSIQGPFHFFFIAYGFILPAQLPMEPGNTSYFFFLSSHSITSKTHQHLLSRPFLRRQFIHNTSLRQAPTSYVY
jgi:hypothetical protein